MRTDEMLDHISHMIYFPDKLLRHTDKKIQFFKGGQTILVIQQDCEQDLISVDSDSPSFHYFLQHNGEKETTKSNELHSRLKKAISGEHVYKCEGRSIMTFEYPTAPKLYKPLFVDQLPGPEWHELEDNSEEIFDLLNHILTNQQILMSEIKSIKDSINSRKIEISSRRRTRNRRGCKPGMACYNPIDEKTPSRNPAKTRTSDK